MKMAWEELWAWQDALILCEARSRSEASARFYNDWWWDLTPAY